MNTARVSTHAVIAATLLTVAPSLAYAHTGAGAATGFAQGFAHPLLGLDHLLAMIAVGVLAAQRGRRALWLLPAAFVSVMIGGFALGAAGIGLPGVELVIAASVLVLGAAVARRVALPMIAAGMMVAVFALFHGHAHGAEMPAAAWSATFASGFAAATLLLHGAGIMIALGARAWIPARIAFDRVLGGAIAVVGLLLLLL